ncbi:transglycosylase SLT domain-containing protein [Streptomyces qinzhouensis]|uniref:Lytic transglycosylase domain-containing protein n=1 Tax=Streptomyces qinzhouensis TaxID=2599401 RepID=A0A5B8JBI5_9ACTN|nr:transglycosylase SLT domain-containing protein [Streptomyces qinzhouensis]QDY78807.1 lytic transglycosylase domain-containing protein [Streptomyces qinzhouensis]
MSRISARGFAVASATAVTTVGAVVGVAAASGNPQPSDNVETAASDATTLLADVPSGEQAQVQAVALAEQAGAQAAAAETTAKKSAEESARIAAAKAAKDKKAAAEAKAKKDREAAKERAERDATRDASSFTAKASYSISEVKDIARQMMSASDFQCFSSIVTKESGWRYTATNPSSGAYGLVQAYPATKMETAGADWRTNPATQIKWGLSYMETRYGGPCGAWAFWQQKRWY